MRNSIFKSYTKKILRSEAFISVIIVFVLALGIIGTSYALYMDVDTDTDYQLVEVGDLKISFDNKDNSTNPNDYNKISLTNMTPMEDEIGIGQTDNLFSFRIYNTGTYDALYDIKLVTDTDNEVELDYINYQLCKETSDTCEEVKTLSGVSDSIIYSDSLKANVETGDFYILRVWINNQYPETNIDQTVSLKVVIEAKNISYKVLADTILESARKAAKEGSTTRTVFTEPDNLPTTPGIDPSGENERILSYADDDYTTITGQPSYYFRGNVEDNYLTFNEMCWRIVRIEGDGSIKIVLTDYENGCSLETENKDKSNIGSGHYGYKTVDGKFLVDYIGNESGMRKAFNDWVSGSDFTDVTREQLKEDNWCIGNMRDAFDSGEVIGGVSNLINSNISFNYIAANKFYDTYTPSLICTKTGLDEEVDENHIGTLTFDEVVFAGASTGEDNSSYIFDNFSGYWWTLSPSYYMANFDSVFSVGNGYFDDFSGGSDSSDFRTFRPSVTLESNIKIEISGIGTIDNPYIVE